MQFWIIRNVSQVLIDIPLDAGWKLPQLLPDLQNYKFVQFVFYKLPFLKYVALPIERSHLADSHFRDIGQNVK